MLSREYHNALRRAGFMWLGLWACWVMTGYAQSPVRYSTRQARERSDIHSLHPLDPVVAESLSRAGIQPAPPCDDAEFLRRVTLDATGYLPTRGELDAFLRDPAPDKRTRKVEELLNTDRYVWRWATFLAHLSGCDESELVYAGGELGISAQKLAYHWLDWVRVRVARDAGYDTIVAGILEATSREDLSGTAYYEWLDAWKQELRSEFTDGGTYAARRTNDLFWRRYSVIYDRDRPVENIATAFLGIRIDCAKCHDHPTDQWTQEDYRGFAATMNRVRYSELPLATADKRRLAWTTSGALGLASLLVAVGLLAGAPRRDRWRRLTNVGAPILAGLIGVMIFGVLSYLHVLLSWSTSERLTPGVFLYQQMTRVASDRLLTVVAGILIATVIGAAAGWMLRSRRPSARRWLASCAINLGIVCSVFVVATATDVIFVAAQSAAADDRVGLPHVTHQRVLKAMGLGGCGDQPREVFVSNDVSRETPPRLLNGRVLPQSVHEDPRIELMNWMRAGESPQLAKNIVNRIWAEYFGAGLVDPVDGFSESNPPSHPQILERLTREFVSHGWSLKHLHRIILTSEAYGRSSRKAAVEEETPRDLARFVPRRLSCEQLITAIDMFTGVPSQFGAANAPAEASAYQVGAVFPWGDEFGARAMRVFGRDSLKRDLRLDGAMFGMMDPLLRRKIEDEEGRLAQLIRAGQSDDEILTELYLAAYSRPPNEVERERIAQYCESSDSRLAAWSDVMWTLVNSQEFQFNH